MGMDFNSIKETIISKKLVLKEAKITEEIGNISLKAIKNAISKKQAILKKQGNLEKFEITNYKSEIEKISKEIDTMHFKVVMQCSYNVDCVAQALNTSTDEGLHIINKVLLEESLNR